MLKYVQLKAGFMGNKVEAVAEMVVLVVLSVFCVFTNVYFLAWQTYIMNMDLVLHLAAVVFSLTELGSALVSMVVFRSLEKK